MPRTHRPAVALLLTLGLALAGLTACAEEEPVPKFAEEPTAAPTPVEKKETAKEFIRRWNDASNQMMAGDSQEYRDLSANCPQCITTADRVDGYYESGGGVDGEPREILDIKTSPRFPDRTGMFSVRFKSLPSVVAESSGGPEQRFPGGTFTNDLLIARHNGEWQVLSYSQAPQ